jgi:hypothetical protein
MAIRTLYFVLHSSYCSDSYFQGCLLQLSISLLQKYLLFLCARCCDECLLSFVCRCFYEFRKWLVGIILFFLFHFSE